jgi:hypothetical protein
VVGSSSGIIITPYHYLNLNLYIIYMQLYVYFAMHCIPIPATVSRKADEEDDEEEDLIAPPGFCSGETIREESLLLPSDSSSLKVKFSDIHSFESIISKTISETRNKK